MACQDYSQGETIPFRAYHEGGGAASLLRVCTCVWSWRVSVSGPLDPKIQPNTHRRLQLTEQTIQPNRVRAARLVHRSPRGEAPEHSKGGEAGTNHNGTYKKCCIIIPLYDWRDTSH